MHRYDHRRKKKASEAEARAAAALTALARLLGSVAAREHVAASCREEGEGDGA